MTDLWREPIKVLADVLKAELVLDEGHIMLAFQKWGIPQDPGLYIALSVLSGKIIANNNYLEPNGEHDANEVQQVTVQELVQIDAMSFDGSARTRLEEILMALASQASLRAQADHHFMIARVPQGFTNTSGLEATANLQRFTTTLIIQSIKTKVKAAEFYDTFSETEVHVNV